MARQITTNWAAFERRDVDSRKGKNPYPKADYMVGSENDYNDQVIAKILARRKAEKEQATVSVTRI